MFLSPIDIDYIRSHLDTRQIGHNILYQYIVFSTMDLALEEISGNAPQGTVVIADTQQQGKGRLERRWVSPPGGVYLSVVIYPPHRIIPSLTMMTCLAVLDCIEEIAAIKPDIKWPNDIHINGKKVGGILALSGISPLNQSYAVIGVGINVIGDLSLYSEIAGIATNLTEAAGKSISREAVICSFLEHFEKRYHLLEANEPLWEEFAANLCTIGKRIKVKSGSKIYEGIAESVNPEGCLLLRPDNAELVVIPAGDITLKV
jgi:BirA family biotin operon repressor/biotin-[acetyl-CoA-carboxylase] ligase